jgi:hypothetical protein
VTAVRKERSRVSCIRLSARMEQRRARSLEMILARQNAPPEARAATVGTSISLPKPDMPVVGAQSTSSIRTAHDMALCCAAAPIGG